MLTPDTVHHLVDAGGSERIPAGHHLVQNDAQGPDVVGFIGQAAGEHFGGHIAQGAACGHGIVRLTSQAEIQKFWRPLRRKPDIAGLDVTMQESLVVQRCQRVCQPGDGQNGLQWRDRTVPQPILKRATGKELHDEERTASPEFDAVDLGGCRMRHRRHGPRFRPQPHQVVGRRPPQSLDRDVSGQLQVTRQIDRSHAPDAQAPRQSKLAGQELRDLSLFVTDFAFAIGRSTGNHDAPADGTLLRRRRLQRSSVRRLQETEARNRQSGGRPERLKKRKVDGAHDPIVETASHHEHAGDLRSQTGKRQDHVGGCLDDPRHIVRRQQREDRCLVLRVDPQWTAGRLQQVDDRRGARQGSDPSVRRAEVLCFRLGNGGNQQDGGRPATALGRPGHRPADRRHSPGLRQHGPRGGQCLPLALGLGENPGVQANQDPFAADVHQQHDPGCREQQLRQWIRGDRTYRALRMTRHHPAQAHRRNGGRCPQQATAHQQPPVARPDHLSRVGQAHREHRIPEQNHPGESHQYYHQNKGRPLKVGHPHPWREHLGDTDRDPCSYVNGEPAAEDDDAPHLVGWRSVRT